MKMDVIKRFIDKKLRKKLFFKIKICFNYNNCVFKLSEILHLYVLNQDDTDSVVKFLQYLIFMKVKPMLCVTCSATLEKLLTSFTCFA